MKNLDLREKYYHGIKDALIYPLKNNDGMLNLASMQRVFVKDNILILVKGDNKISVMDSINKEFDYYLFNDDKSLLKYVTTTFSNGQLLLTFSSVEKDLTIKSGGAIMEINDVSTINQIEKIISDSLVNTIVSIQKTGYANVLTIIASENMQTSEETLLSDLYSRKNEILNRLNGDLIRLRR